MSGNIPLAHLWGKSAVCNFDCAAGCMQARGTGHGAMARLAALGGSVTHHIRQHNELTTEQRRPSTHTECH